MDTPHPNIFQRQDTIFGICQAVGEDFGFNPSWLRLAFVAPLFFMPVQTITAYLLLGVMVFISRISFPDKAGQQTLAETVAAKPAAATVTPALEQELLAA
jgi:phage shock protein C